MPYFAVINWYFFPFFSCKNESEKSIIPILLGDRVSASAVMLNAVTAAYQDGMDYSAAFTSSGTGLAVWTSYSGSGRRVLYALYDPAKGKWSESAELAMNVNAGTTAVASNGTGFMVAFISVDYYVYTMTWSGGSFGRPQKLSIGRNCFDTHLATNGAGYCLVWRQFGGTANTPRAALYDGSAWGDPQELDANNSNNIRVISNGSGYCATWNSNNRLRTNIYYDSGSGWSWMLAAQYADNTDYQDNYQVAGNGSYYVVVFQDPDDQIYARTFNLAVGPTIWSDPTDIDSGANNADVARIAANSANFCVVFSQTDGTRSNVYANFFNGAWSGPAEIDAGNQAATNPGVVSDGSNFCAVWTQNDGTSQKVFANIYSGAWGGAAAIHSSSTDDSYYPAVSSNGSGYLARWVDYTADNYRIMGSVYGGSWGATAAIDAAAMENNPPVAAIVPFTGGYGVYYSANPDNSSMTIEANVLMNGVWGGAVNLYTQEWEGTCLRNDVGSPKILTAGTDTVAVWAQEDLGNIRLMARVKRGWEWGAPVVLANDINQFSAAAGGSNACVAWRFTDDSTGVDVNKVMAQTYDSTARAWSAVEELSIGDTYDAVLVAGSASAKDFCVVWQKNDASHHVIAKVHDMNTGWDAAPHDISSTNQVYITEVLGSDNYYCIIFDRDEGSGLYTNTMVYDITSSSWGDTDLINGPTLILAANMATAASGSSLVIAWNVTDTTPDRMYAKLFDGTWHAPENLGGTGNDMNNPAVAGDGAGGFCLAWQETSYWSTTLFWSTTVYARHYIPGSGWETEPVDMSYPQPYGTGLEAEGPRVASNGTGYAVIFNQRDEYGVASLYANVYDSGLWSGAEPLDAMNSEITVRETYAIASDGRGYGVVWRQNDTTHGAMLYGSSYRGGAWRHGALSNGKGDVAYCAIDAGEGWYTPFWLQKDRKDVLVDNVWINRM